MTRTKQTARKSYVRQDSGRNALTQRERGLLNAFDSKRRCAPVQAATMLCGRVYWLEGIATNCNYCGGCSNKECSRCGYKPISCVACSSNKDLVRDPQTNVVLCERDVLRRTAMQTLVVCKAYGLAAAELKMAVVQAVLGDVPVARMLHKYADSEAGVSGDAEEVADDDGDLGSDDDDE